ncbi:MAG: SH3 domain-containing protein [Candidatus Cloacimonetes bacterium]|nr:SH3 domain-containing protein [Candidatus Cloacimonadota bacterium]
MKAIWTILILSILVFSGLAASEFDEFRALEEQGLQNADLYYNLGVTYWQLGQSGMANLYFLRALNLDSAHKLAKENLEYVIALSQDRDLYPQHLFLLRIFWEIYDYLNLNRMAMLTLILLLLSALSLSWLLNYDFDKERGLPSLIFGICLFLLLSSSTFLGVKAYRQAHNSKAVLILSQAELRAEAEPKASRVAVIHEALVLVVEESRQDWSLVRLPNGISGWIENEAIKRVAP